MGDVPQESADVRVLLRLNGRADGLNDVARQLAAVDRAWTLAVSVEAYQRGYQDAWAHQTQYAPRPNGLRIAKNSPTLVELWQAADAPSIVIGGFGAFVWIVNNVEKVATITDRIAVARSSAQIRRRELERRLDELEAGDDTIFVEPPELPPVAMSGEPQEAVSLVHVERAAAIQEVRRDLDRLDGLEYRREQLEGELRSLAERARSVQRDLERAEPELVQQSGVAAWKPRKRRRL